MVCPPYIWDTDDGAQDEEPIGGSAAEINLRWEEARRHNFFLPFSERLRLHYIEGAHAGLRGEWARTLREEAALSSAHLRRWRCELRAIRELARRIGMAVPLIEQFNEQILRGLDALPIPTEEEMPF